MTYEKLEEQIEPYIDGPFADMPEALRERVTSALDYQSKPFDAFEWSQLTPLQLRKLAKQYDLENSPAMKAENKYWDDLDGEIREAEAAITKWEQTNDGGKPSEALIRENKLAALRDRLNNLNKITKLPPFHAENPKALTDDALAELVSGASGDVTTSNSKPAKKRRNSIDPVIELAQTKCRNPQDTAEVWAQMEVLAHAAHAPFLAVKKTGLEYTKGSGKDYFTRDALRLRLHPELRAPRK